MMEKTKRCTTLLVLISIAISIGIFGAGCQSEPPGMTTNEPASDSAATAPATDPSIGESATPAADPSRITADQLIDVFKDSNVFLLDVRGPEEIEEVGTVEGYTNIPIDELEARLDELPRDQPILTA